MNRHNTSNLLSDFFRNFILVYFFILFVNAISHSRTFLNKRNVNKNENVGFDLYISREEMNRTLGILAEMIYVNKGMINTYSTKFPYRISSNVSHVFFTWNALQEQIKYKIWAVAEDFDVLPVIYIPLEGILPFTPQRFAVEYRCAGSRSGQFLLNFHFNISWPSENDFTYFTLKQEKICTIKDGRRAGSGRLTYNSVDGVDGITQFWSPSQRELLYFGAALFIALCLFCVIFVCFSINATRKNTNRTSSLPRTGAGSTAHSFYTAAALLKAGPSSSLFLGTTNTKVTTFNDSNNKPFYEPNNHVEEFNNTQPLLSSTPFPEKVKKPINPFFEQKLTTSSKPKIIFERRGNTVDINVSLVELNADRNLFFMMPQIEISGQYSELKWANWRQTGIGLSGDVDDEEDDANEDLALICKTLKQCASCTQFERFLREALMFHNVPSHPNLLQVAAAATFGNFNNPNSVQDFPLICYRHAGFGILKKFLATCRGINGVLCSNVPVGNKVSRNLSLECQQNIPNPTLRTHDLVSIAMQILKAIQHLHTFGIIHKDIASRNCLISELPIKMVSSSDHFYVQLGDNSLSNDFFPDEYIVEESIKLSDLPSTSKMVDIIEKNEKSEKELRPLRWMPLEAIRNNTFNSASDVWSFGILMWELFTCGQIPFQDINDKELEIAISSGSRPVQPYNCPDEIYGIMYSCWDNDPLERPTTEQLMRVICDFTHQLRKFI